MTEPKYKVGDHVWSDNNPGIITAVRIEQSPYYKKPCYHYSIHVSYDVDDFEYHINPRITPKYSVGEEIWVELKSRNWKCSVKDIFVDGDGNNIYSVKVDPVSFSVTEDMIKIDKGKF